MDSWEYAVADQFMQGFTVAEIAEAIHKNTLEIMEILQSEPVRAYLDKIREMRKMELEACAEGKAFDVIRGALDEGKMETKLSAADKIWKAAGKYEDQNKTVATLAEILKRVMDEGKED